MYQVKVLSDKEFDSLPYPEMETSLGVADPKTGTAYVRYTGLDAVDKYLVSHELEHLIDGHGGEHSDHYRNGVYYKGFGETLQAVAPALAFIPYLGVGGSMIASGVGGKLSEKEAKKRAGMGSFTGGMFGDAPNRLFQGMHDSGMMGERQQPGSPMEQFKPQAPNIVTPGGGLPQGGASGSNTIGGMMGGGSPIERVRGFFSSRNPQGGL